MSWTFGNDPVNSRLDRIRILIGDTDPAEPLIEDETLLWLIEREPDDNLAAAQAARLIAAKFARQADIAVGELSVRFSQLAESFLELANQLAMESSARVGTDAKTDILVAEPKPPLFYRGQFDRRA